MVAWFGFENYKNKTMMFQAEWLVLFQDFKKPFYYFSCLIHSVFRLILHAFLKWASKVKKPYSQTWNCIKNSISYFAKLIWLKNLIFQQSVTVRHFLQYQPIYCHQPLLASVPLFQSDQLWPILLSLQRDLCLYCHHFICQACQACTLIKVCK